MRKSIKILGVLAIAACFAFAVPYGKESRKIKVVIDAGHGGHDYGATLNTLSEKEITDRIAGKIKAMNTDGEVEIYLTRPSDTYISLNDRIEAINEIKPDLVLSLHLNSTKNTEASGMEFFVSNSSARYEQSADYARKLAAKFEQKSYSVRGVKEANFLLLRKADVPAVNFQIGFLSNENDRKYITDEDKQNEIATLVVDFLEEIK